MTAADQTREEIKAPPVPPVRYAAWEFAKIAGEGLWSRVAAGGRDAVTVLTSVRQVMRQYGLAALSASLGILLVGYLLNRLSVLLASWWVLLTDPKYPRTEAQWFVGWASLSLWAIAIVVLVAGVPRASEAWAEAKRRAAQ